MTASEHDFLSSIRDLVNKFEELIDEAKPLGASSDRDAIARFADKLDQVLAEAGCVLAPTGGGGDLQPDQILKKYIQVYQMYLAMVSIPYMSELVEAVAARAKLNGFMEEYKKLSRSLETLSLLKKSLSASSQP